MDWKLKTKEKSKQHTTHQELVSGQALIMTFFIYIIFIFGLFKDASAAHTIEVRTVWSSRNKLIGKDTKASGRGLI